MRTSKPNWYERYQAVSFLLTFRAVATRRMRRIYLDCRKRGRDPVSSLNIAYAML